MDKQKFRSYSQLFTQAVNQFFEEKETEDFLTEIRKIVQEGEAEILTECNSEVDIQNAMDFINSF